METGLKQKTLSQETSAPNDGNVEQFATQERKEQKKVESSRQSTAADTGSFKAAAPPIKQKPTVAVKPKPSAKPQPSSKPQTTPTPSSLKPQPTAKPQAHIAPIQKDPPLTVESLFKLLEQKVAENDYYQLLGLDESASAEEIARRRRDMTQELHPDQFRTDAAKAK